MSPTAHTMSVLHMNKFEELQTCSRIHNKIKFKQITIQICKLFLHSSFVYFPISIPPLQPI